MGYGDELMVSGIARKMQEKDPRKVRLVYDKGPKRATLEVFDHNPRIAGPEDRDVQILHARPGGLRPYMEEKTPTRWRWLDNPPERGELYFAEAELAHAARYQPDVVIEPHLKAGAPGNKDWGLERWSELVDLLRAAGILPWQLGPKGTQVLPGATFVETQSFRLAAAILARARAAVLPEGGMHHAAAAVRTPAVVIFGGYISPAQTGYEDQVNFYVGGIPCGMRVPCAHCRAAMAAIRPADVFKAVTSIRR